MALLTEIFAAEREINHDEHQRLMAEIAEFESALDALAPSADGHAAGEQVRRLERRLSGGLPQHFATEEKTVLASLGRERPETKPFCKAMKRQHAALVRNWEKFRRMFAEIDFQPARSEAIAEVRQYGHHVSRQLLQHMQAEDRRIAQLLG